MIRNKEYREVMQCPIDKFIIMICADGRIYLELPSNKIHIEIYDNDYKLSYPNDK